MSSAPTVAFIGGGNMARSLIGGLVADDFPPESIRVSDPNAERRRDLQRHFGVAPFEDNTACVDAAQAVVLAVKPQQVKAVAEPLGGAVKRSGALVLSIAAGVREPDLRRWLGGEAAVVRTMPNTPALVGTGATGLYANERVSSEQRDLAETLVRAVGIAVWVEDETLLDAVTAVSGSGPAYFFAFMEALEEAGASLGLERPTARLLALQTALGAAKMALESDEEPAGLRRRVTSPGGTTEKAIAVLEDGDLQGLVRRAAEAAARRAAELGGLLGGQ